ncbi:MAG TPA: MlaD family protein, partial [Planctomycetota bacterium]|nr:MlaD family protein [Planctomycetota bacterium]
PEIRIEFSTADGLEAGKTKLRFKSVEVGEVETVELKSDLSGVIVTARMGPKTEALLRATSRFWVVRPRVGPGGISGLSTLLSGAYLEVDPGLTGTQSFSFVGLEEPPQVPADAPGLKLMLQAGSLGSVAVASPVFHHGIPVGKVDSIELTESGDGLEIGIYIEPDYSHHVRENTRFWNASGIEVSFGAEGLGFSVASLSSLLSGGIEFGTPPNEPEGAPSKSGGTYRLYPDKATSNEVFTSTREFVAYFPESVRGLADGAPVEFRGIRIGTVRDFAFDSTRIEEAIVRVVIDMEPQRVGATMRTDRPPRELLDELIQTGIRARLASGSLLTGALYVEIVKDPESPKQLRGQPDEFEVPTLPSTADVLSSSVAELPQLVSDAQAFVAALRKIAESDEAQGMVGELKGAGSAAHEALDQATAILEAISDKLDAQSDMQVRIASALEELAGGMRSIRQLADLLERHPEALLKGKTDAGD